MAEIVVPGPISGRNYGFRIKGDTPTVDEQQRIDALISQREQAFQQEYAAQFGAPVETGESEGFANYVGEVPKGLARGAVGFLGTAGLGLATLLPEDYELPTREFIRRQAYNLSPQADIGLEDSAVGTVSEGIGSIVPLYATALIPGGQFIAGGAALAAGAGEASERAREAGATQEERNQAALLGAGVGALDLIPIVGSIKRRFGPQFTNRLIDYAVNIAMEGGEEAAQEAVTEVLQNMIEQGYNPDQDLGEGTLAAAGVGGLAGGIVAALFPGRTRPKPAAEETPLALPAPSATLALPAPETATQALQAPGTATPMSARQTPGTVVTPPPPGAVRGSATSNIPNLSPDAAATARSIGSDPQLLSAVEAIEAAGKATTKVLQDAMGLSYSAAQGLLKKLEGMGAVSKYTPGKERALTLPFKVSAVRQAQLAAAAQAPGVAAPAPTVTLPPTEAPKPAAAAAAAQGPAQGVNEAVAEAITAPTAPTEARVIQVLQNARKQQVAGKNQLVSKSGAKSLVDAGLLAPEDVLMAPTANAKVADLLALGPDEVKARMALKAAPAPEVQDDAKAAETQPEAVGTGIEDGGRGMELSGQPVGDIQPTEGAPTPAEGGLGGGLPVPVGTPAAARTEPATLTGSPTELQVRDAIKALAPTQEVREIAQRSALQTELDAQWKKRFADKPELSALIEDYATPDALVLDDPTTSDDRRKVLELLQPGAVKKGKAGEAPAANAQMYFSRFKRPIDALEFIVADATLPNLKTKGKEPTEVGTLPAGDETISPVEQEFFFNMTAERAKKALEWVEANMSPQAQAKVRELQRKYRKSAEAEVENRVSSSAPQSTAIGGRAASLDERQAMEQELSVLSTEEAAKRAEAKAMADAARTRMAGLENLLSAVQEARAPVRRRALGTRKLSPKDQEAFLVDHILGLRFNMPEDVQDLDTPLHPAVVNQLRRGNLPMALRAMQFYAPNARIKRLAAELAKYSEGTTVRLVNNLTDADGVKLSGQYRRAPRGASSEVLLDADTGLSIETLLHEMVHAATVKELFVKSSPMRARLEKLFADVKPLLENQNGAVDLMEFVAEAMSNPKFQQQLSRLHPKGKRFSAFDQFVHEVTNFVRRLFGLQPKPIGSALDVIDQMAFQIMTSPIGNAGGVSMTEISSPQGAAAVMNRVAQINGSFPARTAEFAQQFGDDTSRVLAGASWGAKRTILGFMNKQALTDVASHYKIKGAKDLSTAIDQYDAASAASDSEVDAVLQIAENWKKNNPNLKPVLDRIVETSTTEQVDPSLTRDSAKKKYGEGSDRMRVYDQMQPGWAQLGKDGRDVYNNMRELYRKQYIRLREALAGKIDFVLSSNPELATEVKASIYSKFFDMNQIEPYFPLARSGDFWLEYSMFNPTTGTTEPVKETFDSPNARDRAAKELATIPGVAKDADGKPITNYYTTMDIVTRGRTPDSLFVRDTLSIIRANLAQQNVDKATMDSIQQEITRMFVQALPETSFAKSLQKRKNTKGYITDSFEALRVKAYNLGRQGVRYKYSNKVRAITDEITEQAKGISDTNKVAVIEELQARADFALNPPNDMFEQFTQAANRLAFTFTLGLNVSSALVNLSSIPVVLYPYLAGRYGGRAATVALGDAYKMFLNSGISRELELPGQFQGKKTTKVRSMPSMDNYFVLDKNGEYVLRDDTPPQLRNALEELGPLVDVAAKNGQLNRSVFYDSLGVEGSGRARSLWDRITAASGAMFHQVERANRQVALIAAYKLELDRLRNKPSQAERALTEDQRRVRAAERAVYQVTETSGGATLAAAPRWAQRNIGRVALMFKNYGLSMVYLQMKLAKQLTLGSNDPDFTPEDRRIAFRQLMGLNLSTFALAGVAGMPIYGIASSVADMFLGDDEEDADMLTRRYLGEGLYKGFLTEMSGLDVSSRIGLTGLLVRENRYNTDPSAEELAFHHFGGPAWSTATRFGRGMSEFFSAMTGGEGDMVRGIESMLPVAISNIVKTGRIMAEGGDIETRRKDVVVGDLGSSELLGQVLGFQPARATLQQDINQLKVRVSKNITQKRSDLAKAYYIALRVGDIEGAQEALEDIRSFNAEVGQQFPGAVIDEEFMKDSLKSHERTSAQTQSGVFINPAVRPGLDELGAQYNQGLQLF